MSCIHVEALCSNGIKDSTVANLQTTINSKMISHIFSIQKQTVGYLQCASQQSTRRLLHCKNPSRDIDLLGESLLQITSLWSHICCVIHRYERCICMVDPSPSFRTRRNDSIFQCCQQSLSSNRALLTIDNLLGLICIETYLQSNSALRRTAVPAVSGVVRCVAGLLLARIDWTPALADVTNCVCFTP